MSSLSTFFECDCRCNCKIGVDPSFLFCGLCLNWMRTTKSRTGKLTDGIHGPPVDPMELGAAGRSAESRWRKLLKKIGFK